LAEIGRDAVGDGLRESIGDWLAWTAERQGSEAPAVDQSIQTDSP
jgi:hypothetical protein